MRTIPPALRAGLLAVLLSPALIAHPRATPLLAQAPPPLGDLHFLARFSGHSAALVARGERIFLAADRRIEIYDSADAERPRLLRSSPVLPGLVLDLEIDESAAAQRDAAPRLVALTRAGVHVFEAADAPGPDPVTLHEVQGALRMTVAGGRAYVARGHQILALDLRDPDRQARVWSPADDEPVHELLAFGARVYAARAGRLHALRFDENAGWTELGALELPERITALAGEIGTSGDGNGEGRASAERLYVAAINAGAWALEVGDPADMRVLGLLPSRGVVGIQAFGAGRLVMAQYQDRLNIADFGEPERPLALAELPLSTSGILDLALRGDTLSLTSLEHGLRLIDLSRPEQPRLRFAAEPAVPSDLRAAARLGDRLHLGGGEGGYRLLDASQPARPRLLARLAVPDIQRIAANERLALLITAGDTPGLRLVALEGDAPRLVDPPLLDDAFDVVIRGDHAYVAGDIATLTILDLRGPSPTETFRYAGPPGRRVDTDGRRVFVLGDYSVSAFRLEGPNDAGFMGTQAFDAPLADLALNGDQVYIADRGRRLSAYSAQDFPAPQTSGIDLPDSLVDLVVEDGDAVDRLLGVGAEAGLMVLDFGIDPEAPEPRLLGGDVLPGARALSLAGGLLHVVSPAAGLHVYRFGQRGRIHLPGLSRP